MKLPIFLSATALVTSSLLAACSSTTPASSSSDAPVTSASVPAQTTDVVPELDVAATTLDCSTYSTDAIAFIRQSADVMAGDVQYRVATVACGEPASEVSAEVVEAFVLEMAPGFQRDWFLVQMCHLTPVAPAHQITQQLLAQRLLSVKKAKLGATLKLPAKTMA